MTLTITSEYDIEKYFIQASEAHQSGNIQLALDIYTELLKYLPEVGLLHYNTAHAYFELNNVTSALKHYELASKYTPEDEDILFNLAYCYKQCSRYNDAINSYSNLIELNPSHTDALYNLANLYKDSGQNDLAIDTYLKVLEIAPEHKSSINNLAFLYHKIDDKHNAIVYYKKVLEFDSDNISAQYMVSTLSGDKLDSAPKEYVETIFDNYSAHYEKSLVEELGYSVPQKLKTLFLGSYQKNKQFENGLDLGCGSGLAGIEFVDFVSDLVGIDISTKMLELADDKKIYSHLIAEDIHSYLLRVDNTFDFVVAADVLTYMGEIDKFFSLLSKKVTHGCPFLFSTELCEDEFKLRSSGRFAHSFAYIQGLAEKTGWTVLQSQTCDLRKERDNWIEGKIYLLQKM